MQASDIVQKAAFTALIVSAACLAVRHRKRIWKWFTSEPEATYRADDVMAELYMDGHSEDYPGFVMQWDD